MSCLRNIFLKNYDILYAKNTIFTKQTMKGKIKLKKVYIVKKKKKKKIIKLLLIIISLPFVEKLSF